MKLVPNVYLGITKAIHWVGRSPSSPIEPSNPGRRPGPNEGNCDVDGCPRPTQSLVVYS